MYPELNSPQHCVICDKIVNLHAVIGQTLDDAQDDGSESHALLSMGSQPSSPSSPAAQRFSESPETARCLQQLTSTWRWWQSDQTYYRRVGAETLYYCQEHGPSFQATYLHRPEDVPTTPAPEPDRSRAFGPARSPVRFSLYGAASSPLQHGHSLQGSPSVLPGAAPAIAASSASSRGAESAGAKLNLAPQFAEVAESPDPLSRSRAGSGESVSEPVSAEQSSAQAAEQRDRSGSIVSAWEHALVDEESEFRQDNTFLRREKSAYFDDIYRNEPRVYDAKLRQSCVKPPKLPVIHNLLINLSETYTSMYLVVLDKKKSLRQQVMPEGWLFRSIQPQLLKIQQEVKQTVEYMVARARALNYPGLYQQSPLVWSMQFITTDCIERTIIAADTSWRGKLPTQQNCRYLAVALVVMLIVLIVVVPEVLKAKPPVRPRPVPPPGPTPTPSASSTVAPRPTSSAAPTPTPPAPTSSAAPTPSSSATSTAAPRPTSSAAPTPSSSATSTAAPRPSVTSTAAPRPSPTPAPPPPPTVNCNVGTTCEAATHWQAFQTLVNHNLQAGVETLAELKAACGPQGNLAWIFTKCYPADTTLFNMLSNGATPLTQLAQYLAGLMR